MNVHIYALDNSCIWFNERTAKQATIYVYAWVYR